MNQRTRKLMTMHKVLNTRDDIDRLYVSRKKGRRGLVSIKDYVQGSLNKFPDFFRLGNFIDSTHMKL